MSTVVLARKYRPRRFDQTVGQPHVVQALGHALAQQRLHHAYLFTGTRGIGKTTISRILAKSLNCVGPDGTGGITAEPCGVCPSCTAIDADRFVDYIELDAASNRSIDEVRDLIERAAYKPSVGRFKVFMIDEAHQLTKDAFNALLKTLEEPPEYLKFVLATTDPEKMLPTVLSRCLQFNLRPMAPEVVHAHLATVLAAEGIESEPAALRLLGRAARGSMRDALSLTDQAIAYGGGRIGEAVVRAMLGVADQGQALGVLQAVAARDGTAVREGVQALREAGASAPAVLDAMATLLQATAVEQAVPGALDDDDPDTPGARALAAAMAADETQLLYSIVLQGRAELALASDEHGALTMVLLRLFAFPPAGAAPPPASVRPRALRAPTVAVATVSPAPRSLPSPGADTKPAAAGAAPDAGSVPRDLGDRWSALVAGLVASGAVSALTRELAMQAGLFAVDEPSGAGSPTRWRLWVARESLRAPVLAERLGAALAAALGKPAVVQLLPGQPDDTPALREAAARARRQREAEQVITADPVVVDLLERFPGARIVPGSIQPLDPTH